MMRMQKQMSQLLITDIQDKVLAPIPNKNEIIEKAGHLIRAATVLDVPVTVSEHYPQGLGNTIGDLKNLLSPETSIFDKMHFSCVQDEKLHHHLEDYRDQGRGQIIVAGIEAHVCVTQTALDLIADGYEVFIVADAVGSRGARSCELGLRRLQRCGAFLVDTEMVLFEWLEQAGTPEFKSLLPLIK